MPGQILGDRYEVEQQLGKKAGRWTLLARDLTDNSPVILKILSIGDDQAGADDLRLFKREIEILQTLSHPATPKYLGYFEIELPKGKALVLIQSYIAGKSLDQYLQEGRRLAEAEAKQIANATLQILDYLHDHDPPVVHRDIKPSNILLFDQPDRIASQVCLVDFGSVKSLSGSDHNTTFMVVGTDGYRPPEQVGRRAVRASDLYSLGVTLVTAMTGIEPGRLPRRGLRIDLDQIEAIVKLDPAFANWLKRVTDPDLDQRFKTVAEAYSWLNQSVE